MADRRDVLSSKVIIQRQNLMKLTAEALANNFQAEVANRALYNRDLDGNRLFYCSSYCV